MYICASNLVQIEFRPECHTTNQPIIDHWAISEIILLTTHTFATTNFILVPAFCNNLAFEWRDDSDRLTIYEFFWIVKFQHVLTVSIIVQFHSLTKRANGISVAFTCQTTFDPFSQIHVNFMVQFAWFAASDPLIMSFIHSEREKDLIATMR